MIKFQEKSYSTGDVVKGGTIGATAGYSASKLLKSMFPDKLRKIATESYKNDKGNKVTKDIYETVSTAPEVLEAGFNKLAEGSEKILAKLPVIGKYLDGINRKFWDRLIEVGKFIQKNPTTSAVIGALVGASIAAGYYLIKASYNKTSNYASKLKGDFKGRMIEKVAEALVAMGYKSGVDFTTDPAQADYLKTKVCIIVSSTKDEVGISINSINEPKLEPVSRAIIKNLPSGTKFYKRESGSNNELTLAMTGSNNGDPTYIASIVERFIRKKYPVFLIEIN